MVIGSSSNAQVIASWAFWLGVLDAPVTAPPAKERRRVDLVHRHARDRVGHLATHHAVASPDDPFHLADLGDRRPVEVVVEQVGRPQAAGLDPVAVLVDRPVLDELPRGALTLTRGKRPRPRPG